MFARAASFDGMVELGLALEISEMELGVRVASTLRAATNAVAVLRRAPLRAPPVCLVGIRARF